MHTYTDFVGDFDLEADSDWTVEETLAAIAKVKGFDPVGCLVRLEGWDEDWEVRAQTDVGGGGTERERERGRERRGSVRHVHGACGRLPASSACPCQARALADARAHRRSASHPHSFRPGLPNVGAPAGGSLRWPPVAGGPDAVAVRRGGRGDARERAQDADCRGVAHAGRRLPGGALQ
eukprot:PRCOL_00002922-RA